jgi:hypothetical protein
MIKWNDLNGTEQFVAESVICERDNGMISADEYEIYSAVVRWSGEYGFANEEMGNLEEADVEKVFEYVIGGLVE